MNSVPEFIEILRVSGNRDSKINNVIKPETILVSDIKSFRAWHKGKNDFEIKGDMTIIIVKPDAKVENPDISQEGFGGDGRPKVKTILIKESYKDFLTRMGAHVPIRKLDDYYVVDKNGKVTNASVIRHPSFQQGD